MRSIHWLSVLLLVGCASSEIDGTGSDAGFDDGRTPLNSLVNNVANNRNNINNQNNLADGGITDTSDAAVDMGVMCEPSGAGWETLGTPIDAVAGITPGTRPSVEVDAWCRPVVGFHENVDGESPNVWVYRFENGGWVGLGTGFDATGTTDKWTTSVEIATYGNQIYAAWAELKPDNSSGVFVATFNGSDWDLLPEVPTSGSIFSFTMALVVDSNGDPIVSWNQNAGINTPTSVHVAKFSNNSWAPLGAAIRDMAGNAAALAPSLIVDEQDQPIVAWQESNFLHVRSWDGATWTNALGTPVGTDYAFDANLAISSNGQIALGWREAGGVTTSTFVSKLAGVSWTPLVTAIDSVDETNGRTNTNNVALAVDSSGRAVYAYDEPLDGTNQVFVHRDVDPIGVLDAVAGAGTSGLAPSIAIDPDDRPVVAWYEGEETTTIHVWRYGE